MRYKLKLTSASTPFVASDASVPTLNGRGLTHRPLDSVERLRLGEMLVQGRVAVTNFTIAQAAMLVGARPCDLGEIVRKPRPKPAAPTTDPVADANGNGHHHPAVDESWWTSATAEARERFIMDRIDAL